MDLPKLDNTNLWDKTYVILKDRILKRDFQADEKLSIPELASQLGVSRTPIRDALNRLETEGLVKTISKVGTFVNAIDTEDFLNIMDTRLMLELWIIDKLSVLAPEKLHEMISPLENILNQASQLVVKLPVDEFLQLNYNLQFHVEFIKLGNNKRNVEIYLSLMQYQFLAIELTTREMVINAIRQHYLIIDALKMHNFEEARTAIRLHLEDSKNRLLEQLESNGGKL